MKKKFASLVALSMALTLTFGMTVSAAGSTSTSTSSATQESLYVAVEQNQAAAQEVTKTAVVDGVKVDVVAKITALEPKQVAAAEDDAKERIAEGTLQNSDGVKVERVENGLVTGYDLKLLTGPANTAVSGKITVDFPVVGVVAGRTYAIFHWTGYLWEAQVTTAAASNQLTGTFNGLSPIIIMEVKAVETPAKPADTTTTDTTATTTTPAPAAAETPVAPKTGEALPFAAVMTLVCLAGAALFSRKARA